MGLTFHLISQWCNKKNAEVAPVRPDVREKKSFCDSESLPSRGNFLYFRTAGRTGATSDFYLSHHWEIRTKLVAL